jgi:predicted O-methyltransferase YrrM
MNIALRKLLNELEAWGRQQDAAAPTHQARMRNLDPDTARLVSLFVRSSQRQSLLEIGTSNGYSTIWLAWAASLTGGHLTSIERDKERQALANTNLRRAGLRDRVDLLLGDATEVVRGLAGTFDCVFFDADRVSAPDQLALLRPRLLPGTLLMADNALSHPDEIAPYLAAVESIPGVDHMIVPLGKGLSVAYLE